MSEVKRYHVGDSGLVEGESLGRINVVLGSDYDQLNCKVGNMVCAKRQMDEELEIARDDLAIFKGALSALGEASKKLVVCARTSGGTAGSDKGLMDACADVEGVITLAGVARAINEFERIKAERDALQLRLNVADQRVGDLETQLDGAQDQLGAAWDVLHAAGIASPGTLSVAEGIAMLMQAKVKDAIDPAAEACQFPQSCTTRCDCDIPDFSPGNGNKARRRADALNLKGGGE